jgi:hypothetical protein
VKNLPLVVDAGVAACDDGGEPLLGCYTPPGPDASGLEDHRGEIRLFYRTFQSELRLDPTFDVKGQIFETIDHEVEHHLYFLAGHDPMDAEERAAIVEEKARVVGKKELARRQVRELRGGLLAMFPLLLLLVLLAGLQLCRD